MKNKLFYVVLLSAVSISAMQVQAASHKHLHKLQQAHCTQVQEANGLCDDIHHAQQALDESEAMQKARELDMQIEQARQQGKDVARKFEMHDDENVKMFCDDLPADATNWQRKECVK